MSYCTAFPEWIANFRFTFLFSRRIELLLIFHLHKNVSCRIWWKTLFGYHALSLRNKGSLILDDQLPSSEGNQLNHAVFSCNKRRSDIGDQTDIRLAFARRKARYLRTKTHNLRKENFVLLGASMIPERYLPSNYNSCKSGTKINSNNWWHLTRKSLAFALIKTTKSLKVNFYLC